MIQVAPTPYNPAAATAAPAGSTTQSSARNVPVALNPNPQQVMMYQLAMQMWFQRCQQAMGYPNIASMPVGMMPAVYPQKPQQSLQPQQAGLDLLVAAAESEMSNSSGCESNDDSSVGVVAKPKRKANTNKSPKKKYDCKTCGRVFGCSSNLKRHSSIHTGVKPYKCGYCGQAFSNSSNRRKHERTHRKHEEQKLLKLEAKAPPAASL